MTYVDNIVINAVENVLKAVKCLLNENQEQDKWSEEINNESGKITNVDKSVILKLSTLLINRSLIYKKIVDKL